MLAMQLAVTQQLMGFCSTHSLVAVQTWHPEQMSVAENWSTWFHRGSEKHHLKDLILIPADDKAKVSVCKPYNTSIQTDHRLVLCRFMVPAVKRIWEQANYASPHMSIKGKLRRLT
jgi:hypothetical protein